MNFYKNKKILVTGGTGMIGRSLVKSLLNDGADVTIVSLDDFRSDNKELRFIKSDLREFSNCINLCKNKDIVFHLAGVKGSPDMTKKKPASFFVPTITFNTNILEASRRCNVENVLYTSSIGVYSPSKNFIEEDVWKTFPSENDRFAGWAKRMGELQAEAYSIEDGYSTLVFPQKTRTVNFSPDEFNSVGVKLAKKANVPLVPIALKTDFWKNGKIIKDFGNIDRSKKIFFRFGEPIHVTGNGKEDHEKIVQFIVAQLAEWENLPEPNNRRVVADSNSD